MANALEQQTRSGLEKRACDDGRRIITDRFGKKFQGLPAPA
jgi:hypothetical protein